AIIKGTAGFRRVQAVRSNKLFIPTQRTTNIHGGATRDSTIEVTSEYDIPFAVTVLFNVYHGNTVRCDFLTDLILRPGAVRIDGCPARMDGALVDVLMVHHQKTFSRTVTATLLIDREKMHAIVVHAHLLLLIGTCVGAISPVIRIGTGNGRTPRQECLC